jgi:hypothetical protein
LLVGDRQNDKIIVGVLGVIAKFFKNPIFESFRRVVVKRSTVSFANDLTRRKRTRRREK